MDWVVCGVSMDCGGLGCFSELGYLWCFNGVVWVFQWTGWLNVVFSGLCGLKSFK